MALCLLWIAAPVWGASAPVPEYHARAGYLLLFTRYVTWPESVFPSADAPIVIGVLGRNPFGDVLRRTVAELRSQGRPIEVREVHDAAAAARCHLVYVAGQQDREEAGWLAALRGQPILIVTESVRNLEAGAVLALTLEESARGPKVAFSVNLANARQTGLRISASMLASARRVLRKDGTEEVPG